MESVQRSKKLNDYKNTATHHLNIYLSKLIERNFRQPSAERNAFLQVMFYVYSDDTTK